MEDERPLARPSWLTYAQAGERLGLSPEALRHRAHGAGWRLCPATTAAPLVPDDTEAVRTAHAGISTHNRAERAFEAALEAVRTAHAGISTHDHAERAFEAALEAVRTAHAGEVARLTEALTRAEGRIDAVMKACDGLRERLIVRTKTWLVALWSGYCWFWRSLLAPQRGA